MSGGPEAGVRELAWQRDTTDSSAPHRKHVNRAHAIPLEVHDREPIRGVDERHILLARHELREDALLATALLFALFVCDTHGTRRDRQSLAKTRCTGKCTRGLERHLRRWSLMTQKPSHGGRGGRRRAPKPELRLALR